ncbi:hypothetical protein MMC22_007252 [Lobaria immixta]|nr:hypothetical protein [Lobaria immixta]
MKRPGGKSPNALLLVDFVQGRAIKNKGEEKMGLKKADDNVSQDEDGGDEIVSQEADEEVTELESSPGSAFESENFEEAPELPNSGISSLAAISDSSITSVLNKASEIQKMNGPDN